FSANLPWPRISVVVCTYNGARTIRDCLDGLEQLAYPDYEVIVVDDGSTDSTAAIACQYDYRLIRTENRGLANARNTGLHAATGGFDPQCRTAGDDVDVSWRLQEQGWTLGFSPAAMVWHHRRNSLRTYWKQQIGYGRAEAMLERKWPEKYNGPGHVRWAGRIYGSGLTRALRLRRARGDHGIWGLAPDPSL